MLPEIIQDMWDVYQEIHITQLDREVDGLASEIAERHGSFQADLGHAEDRLDRLALLCRAMHELLKQHGLYDNRMLRDKVLEIDMRDGRRDDKFTPQPKKCPRCDAMICRRFNRCLFCGYQDSAGSPFHQVE